MSYRYIIKIPFPPASNYTFFAFLQVLSFCLLLNPQLNVTCSVSCVERALCLQIPNPVLLPCAIGTLHPQFLGVKPSMKETYEFSASGIWTEHGKAGLSPPTTPGVSVSMTQMAAVTQAQKERRAGGFLTHVAEVWNGMPQWLDSAGIPN